VQKEVGSRIKSGMTKLGDWCLRARPLHRPRQLHMPHPLRRLRRRNLPRSTADVIDQQRRRAITTWRRPRRIWQHNQQPVRFIPINRAQHRRAARMMAIGRMRRPAPRQQHHTKQNPNPQRFSSTCARARPARRSGHARVSALAPPRRTAPTCPGAGADRGVFRSVHWAVLRSVCRR